jgi:hypothetical protein
VIRAAFIVVTVLISSYMAAQTLSPSSTYRLHATKESNGPTLIAMTPDNALITIAGRLDGLWELKRLSAWFSAVPKEETLPLKGFSLIPSGRLRAELFMSPDGRYAISKLQTTSTLLPSGSRPQAVINVVDLSTFTVVTTLETTDPLLAGFWEFSANGVLIAIHSDAEKPKDQGYSIRENTAAISIPDLNLHLPCSYRNVFGPVVQAGRGWRRDTSSTDLSENCEPLMKSVNAVTINALVPSNSSRTDLANKLYFQPPTDFSSDQMQACAILGVSKDGQFALYDCSAAHQTWYDSVKTTANSYFVISVPQAKRIGSVIGDRGNAAGASLAEANSRNYLLVLRNQIDLSIYPLPTRP